MEQSNTKDKTLKTLEEFAACKEQYTAPDIGQPPRKMAYSFFKRFFDILCSLIAVIVLLIPSIIVALIIVIDSPGSPMYSQIRLGLYGKPFKIYKFRTMTLDAEKDGMRWADLDDARVTSVGGFLRRTKIDEIPQLINIIRGDMSIVGPRPERPEFYDVFDQYIHGFKQRMLVKPGLTGFAQVYGGLDLQPEEKILFDIEYIQNRSLTLDIKIILKTVLVIFTSKKEKNKDDTDQKNFLTRNPSQTDAVTLQTDDPDSFAWSNKSGVDELDGEIVTVHEWKEQIAHNAK